MPTPSLFCALMLVAGGVIGSGLFRKARVMAVEVGSPQVRPGVWLLAGVVSILGAARWLAARAVPLPRWQ